MEATEQRLRACWFVPALIVPAFFILSSCGTLEVPKTKQAQAEVTPARPSEPAPEPETATPAMIEPPASPPVEMPKVGKTQAAKGPVRSQSARTRKPAAPRETTAPKEPATLAVAPDDLVGSDFASVLRVLREPNAVEKSALSVVWIYSDSDCMLRLFFYPEIATAKFHLLKYEFKSPTGERLAESSVCMQHITLARNDAGSTP